jgi:hypothetical protein
MISGVLHVQGIVFDEIDGTCSTAEKLQQNPTLFLRHQSMYTENAYRDSEDLWEHVVSCLTRYFGPALGAISLLLAGWYSLLDYLVQFEPAEGSMWTQEGLDERAIAWLLYSQAFQVSGKSLLDLAHERCGYDIRTRPERPAGYDDYDESAFPLGHARKEALRDDLINGEAEATLAPVFNDNMRFMTTKRGYVGWSHIRGRRWDKICILEGCSVPVILRAREDGGYNLVGDAYVDGIMQGEALNGSSTSIKTLEIY